MPTNIHSKFEPPLLLEIVNNHNCHNVLHLLNLLNKLFEAHERLFSWRKNCSCVPQHLHDCYRVRVGPSCLEKPHQSGVSCSLQFARIIHFDDHCMRGIDDLSALVGIFMACRDQQSGRIAHLFSAMTSIAQSVPIIVPLDVAKNVRPEAEMR